jgi:heme-degrading monooxygenase HmoA
LTETYTSGAWIVKPGDEDAFVREWTAFVTWASGMSGSSTFRLVRDLDRAGRYTSFAAWESFEAQQAWKELPEFQERIMRVRSHCEDFEPSTLELVAEVS